MQVFLNWIDREIDRLDCEGMTDADAPEPAPDVLRAVLGADVHKNAIFGLSPCAALEIRRD